MITKEQVLTQLNGLNVESGSPVIVHCSMRAVGDVEGGAQTLLDALIERFTKNNGLLIIPTHTWANFEDKKEIVLDYTQNSTCTGALSNVALNDKRGYRSANVTHSVKVFGKSAKEFSSLDDKQITPCSPNGIYGAIAKGKGYVLLIGVGQEKNTFLHCVEEYLNLPNRLSKTPVKMGVRLPDASVIYKDFHYLTEELGDTSLLFPKLEKPFRHYGCITDCIVGKASTQLCSADKMQKVFSMIYANSNGQELFLDDKPIAEKLYK